MNSLERFKASFRFEKTDRLPIHTFGGWPETIQRWEQEGLPADWLRVNFFGEDRCGGTGVHLGTNGFSPFFPREPVTEISEDDNYRVFRDEHGRTIKQKKTEVNISVAEYLEFPVTDRKSWEVWKRKLDPTEATRFEDMEKTAARHGGINGHDYPILQNLSGTYRLLWHLFGDVNMCYVLFDDPALVHEIMQTWLELNCRAIDRIMGHVDINLINIMEDMSCNTGMMISPAHFREFMMPYYRELVQHVKRYHSVFGVWVDSDGDVSDLIPLLLECGVQGMYPFEVQAGMDVTALRRQYGDRLVIRGGIDKRELPKGRDAIDRELDRVLPAFVESGGYFICLDHQAPPDVSLENYIYFLEQARKYT